MRVVLRRRAISVLVVAALTAGLLGALAATAAAKRPPKPGRETQSGWSGRRSSRCPIRQLRRTIGSRRSGSRQPTRATRGSTSARPRSGPRRRCSGSARPDGASASSVLRTSPAALHRQRSGRTCTAPHSASRQISPELQLAVRVEVRDADPDEAKGSRSVGERAVEERACELTDARRVVDSDRK